MSRELEEQLAAVPERWRDATRTRTYAVIDYVVAGDDGGLLVKVLCRRTGLTTSAFYTLVRKWKASGGDVTSMVPWARQPGSKPRVPAEATAHIDRKAAPLIAEEPGRPTEPIAQGLLADWPDNVPRPGINYIRKRVNLLRTDHQKKIRRTRPDHGDDGETSEPTPRPRWPLDVIVVDHVAVQAVIGDGDEPTMPIVTFAIDAASRQPVGGAMTLDDPGPAEVARAIAGLAAFAAAEGAPGPPTIVLATAFARGWPELTVALRATGAKVIARRSKKFSFGPVAMRLLGGIFGGYRLAPRLGHRPRADRVTPRAMMSMPLRDLSTFSKQASIAIDMHRRSVVREESWPPAATPDTETWKRLAALSVGSPDIE